MRTTCLIFDVDGTLVDSAGFEDTLYKAALRSVLGDVFLRAAWSEYEHVTDVGLLREICRDNGLSAAQFEQQVRACFGELVAAHLQRAGPCRPTPGAIRLWDTLRADPRFEMGIATGGWGHTARMKLDSAGFNHQGIALTCADLGHERTHIMRQCRELLQATRDTVYFGDGEWDLAAARALGWRFVGVGSRLKGKCPDWIADFSSLTPERIGG
jgi:phosphoglycolate phosphatase-like HAD superfamily hydrolase